MEKKSKNQIPSNAKRAFKGAFFEVWQWEQKLYDGSTAIFERVKRPDTVDIIATVGDKIIVEVQEQPSLAPFTSLPGGVVDGGGDAMENAKREFREETGYVSDDWQRWRRVEFSQYRLIFTQHFMLARSCRKVGEPQLDAGEKISLRFLTFDEMLFLSEDPMFRNKELATIFLRIRLDRSKRDEFYELLFPGK